MSETVSPNTIEKNLTTALERNSQNRKSNLKKKKHPKRPWVVAGQSNTTS